MTREEAIKMLKAKLECMTRDVSGSDDDCNHKRCDECHLNYEKGNMGEQKEYLNMAIKALEQEPCEDYISRQAVLKELKESAENHANDSREEVLLRRDRDIIRAFPPVIPQSKMGRWININESEKWKCSECERMMWFSSRLDIKPSDYKFCPNCGAKMEVEE